MGQVVPFMFFSYYTIFCLDLIVPIQGRSNASSNPELLIAILVFCLALMLGGLLLPTLSLFKQSFYIVCTFLVIFLACVIVMITPVGFPYKSEISPQRFWIFVSIINELSLIHDFIISFWQHTERSFYNFGGNLRKQDSVYFMLAMDRHSDDYASSKKRSSC